MRNAVLHVHNINNMMDSDIKMDMEIICDFSKVPNSLRLGNRTYNQMMQ